MRLTGFEVQIENYLLACTSKNLSKKTLASYEQTLRLFAAFLKDELGVTNAEDVTKTHIRQYIKYVQERGKYTITTGTLKYNEKRKDVGKQVSVNTINSYVRNIKAFFNWLAEEEEIDKNPVEKIRQLKGNERLKPLLSKEEIHAVLSSFDKFKFDGMRNYVITLFMLDTGARISETLAITMDDLDLNNKIVTLRNTKNKKERNVFFSAKLKTALKRWIQMKERFLTSGLLFPSNRGNQMLPGNYEIALRKIGKRLSIELFPHRLRATFAQYYLLNGGDLYTLSRLLGHSSPDVTKTYLQLDDKAIARQYQRFSPLDHLKEW